MAGSSWWQRISSTLVGGQLDKKRIAAVVRQFFKDETARYWHWAPIDGDIVEGAMKAFTSLPEPLFLRSIDCLHLVTAVHQNFDGIFTHDRHQQKAASAFGLSFVSIGTPST